MNFVFIYLKDNGIDRKSISESKRKDIFSGNESSGMFSLYYYCI